MSHFVVFGGWGGKDVSVTPRFEEIARIIDVIAGKL
jgi:hypothetical protein